MKILLSVFIICFLTFGANSALAEEGTDNKENLISVKRQNKSGFKISEQKILKSRNIEEQEVSNFSMEELRSGVQRKLDPAEIQYFKSQCRYAFMSEKEVIANRCEVKAVNTSK